MLIFWTEEVCGYPDCHWTPRISEIQWVPTVVLLSICFISYSAHGCSPGMILGQQMLCVLATQICAAHAWICQHGPSCSPCELFFPNKICCIWGSNPRHVNYISQASLANEALVKTQNELAVTSRNSLTWISSRIRIKSLFRTSQSIQTINWYTYQRLTII